MAFHWLKIFVRCYATVRMDFTNTFGEVTTNLQLKCRLWQIRDYYGSFFCS